MVYNRYPQYSYPYDVGSANRAYDGEELDNVETTTTPATSYWTNTAQTQSFGSATSTATYSNYVNQSWQPPVQYSNTTYPTTTVTTPYYNLSPHQNPSAYATVMGQGNYVQGQQQTYLSPNTVTSSTLDLDCGPPSPSSEGTESISPSISTQSGGGDRPHTCPIDVEGRPCVSSFKRKADLQRHVQCVHRKGSTRMWYCDAPRCDRNSAGSQGGFTRKDHLTEHLRSYHHRDIPKRRRGRSLDEGQPETSTAQQGNAYPEQATSQSFFQSSSYPGPSYSAISYQAGNYSSNSYQSNSQ